MKTILSTLILSSALICAQSAVPRDGCADAGSTDTYACNYVVAPGWITGHLYWFMANTANTGAASINFNSAGAKTIKKVAGGVTTDLDDNDIRAGQWIACIYDGTNCQMASQLGNVASGSGGGAGFHGTATLGTSPISSGACASVVTVSQTGMATTDALVWSFNSDPTAVNGYIPSTSGMLAIIAYPTTNNANFKVCNNTASTITPSSAITLNFAAAAGAVASGTSALGTSSITSGNCATVVTTSATGAATTSAIAASFNGDPTAVMGYSPSTAGMLTIIGYPTANNVNWKVCNNTMGSIAPGAITLNWRVF